MVWLIFRLVGSVVTVPVAEELAFRGYLTRRAIAADFGFYEMMETRGYDRPAVDRCLADAATANRIAAQTLEAGMNFTFVTEFGPFDILGHVEGVRSYKELRDRAEIQVVGGIPVRVASLNHLIGMKRKADRPKDQLLVEEYISMERLRREWDARHRRD